MNKSSTFLRGIKPHRKIILSHSSRTFNKVRDSSPQQSCGVFWKVLDKEIQFSIVIPALNEEKYLAESIACVFRQQGGFSYEIIVVNNGSTDKTKQIAESLGVRVIDEPIKGVGRARKTGTEVAQGKFILQIDADTHLPEDYLTQVFDCFKKDPKLVCLGGQFYYYDAEWWKIFLRPFFHWLFWFFVLIASRAKIGPMGNNMIFKKEFYNKTSGFDSGLKFGEDMDLSIKLSKFGKIKLDMSLLCHISSRRYKIDGKLWVYFLNFLSMALFNKPYKNYLPKQ